MVYVTMTDKFMSGWGKAEGKINKFVVECKDYQQASKVLSNARQRPEMKYVNVAYSEPRYSTNKYITSYRKFDELGTCWTR